MATTTLAPIDQVWQSIERLPLSEQAATFLSYPASSRERAVLCARAKGAAERWDGHRMCASAMIGLLFGGAIAAFRELVVEPGSGFANLFMTQTLVLCFGAVLGAVLGYTGRRSSAVETADLFDRLYTEPAGGPGCGTVFLPEGR